MNLSSAKERLAAWSVEHGLHLLLIAVANAVIYFDHWAGTTVFTGKDTFTAYMPLINFQADCLREGSLPLWNPFLNFGFPYVEDVLNSTFFPTHFLMALVTGSSMVIYQRELLFWIFLGGAGIYLCVREFGSSGPAGVVAAVSFMFCGQLVSLPTWSIIVYNACCFPYLILGYHRAKRRDDPLSLVSIIFLALTQYAGYVSSSVHGMYYFAGYVFVDSLLSRRPRFGITYLVVTAVPAMLIAMPKLLPIALSMGDYERMSVAEARANPLEIISLYNFLSFLLPVKYYFSVYIGQMSFLAVIYAAIRRTIRVDALLVLAVLSGWLLLVDGQGNFSLLHTAANAVLPMMKLTRNEWMYWNYPLTFGILYCAKYFDALLRDDGWRHKALAGGVLAAALTTAYLGAYDTSVHAEAYAVHLALVGGWTAAAVFLRREGLRTAAVALLVLVEFLAVFNRTTVDRPYRLTGNTMDVMLTHQVYSSMSFRDDELVRQTMPYRVLWDADRPAVSDSRRVPLLISGLDGNFVDNMNQKRFTGWWYNTQERFDFVALKESPMLAQLDGQPLFTHYRKGTASELPGVATFDAISCSDLSFTVRASEPGFFLLRQMYDPRWRVDIDGTETRPVRADRYFMGVEVGPGEHRLHFVFSDAAFTASLAAAALTLAGAIAAAVVRARRRRSAPGTAPA